MKEIAEFSKLIAYAQADGGGIQSLSRILMQKLEKPIIVTDSSGEVLSWHSPANQEIFVDEKLTPPISGNNEKNPTKCIIVVKGKKFPAFVWYINEQKQKGFVFVLSEQLEERQHVYIDLTVMAMMVEMVRQQELAESIQAYKDDFIHDILFNNYDGFDTAIRAGRNWGWDFSLPHNVIVIDTNSDQNEIDELRKKIEKYFNVYASGVITGKMGDLLVALYPITEQVHGSWKIEISKIFKKIQAETAINQLCIGVGKLYKNTSMLYRSYQQAKVALELGKMAKSTGVAFFDELGAIRLFYNQSEQDLEDFVQEILGPIIDYDQDKEGNLLLTLWVYFQANTNVPLAAKNLYIHVNTLRYRITRIEELLGKSLEEEETRFNMYSALKIAAMLGKL